MSRQYPYLEQALPLLVALQFTPLIFSTLISFSTLFLKSGKIVEGHELVGFILNHSDTNQEIRDAGEALLAEYGDRDTYQQSIEVGKQLSLAQVVEALTTIK